MAATIGATSGDAATSGSVVGATVPSATNLDTSGCNAGLALGALVIGTTSIGPGCDIQFGSSNDTSGLRLFQSDGDGTALTQYATTNPIRHSGAFDYNDVSAKNDSEAWAVGGARKTGDPTPITHTTDGGATWSMQTSCAAGVDLQDVDYVTGTTVVAVGTASSICRSTNSGATWTTVTTPSSGIWYSVDIRSDGLGWLVGAGGRVATTTDGGATWASLPVPDPTWALTGVVAASTTRLYAIGFAAGPPRTALALTSADAGATWTSTALGTSASAWAYGLVALSPTTAVATSAFGKFRTVDSGATWTQTDAQSALCVTAASATTLLSYNSQAQAPRISTDAGVTWSAAPSPSPFTGQMFGCDSSSPTRLWLAGNNDQRLFSADTGATYTVAATTFRDLRAVAAWSRMAWTAVGDFGAIRTSANGGTTITSPASGTGLQLNDVTTVSTTSAIAVGASGTILRSTNRGVSWSTIAPPTGVDLRDVERGPDGVLYAVGASTLVLSNDGGLVWNVIAGAPAATITAIASAPLGVLWIGTSTGDLYRSTNRGGSWTLQASGTTLSITSIDTVDGVTAIATTVQDAAADTHVLRTTNGGGGWATSLFSGNGYAVAFADPSSIVISTNGGYRRSTDGGVTWTARGGVTNAYGIAALDLNTFVLAAQGDVLASIVPAQSFTDYGGGTDFLGGTSVFGACLETATGTATTLWPVAGTGNCTPANTTMWRGVAVDAAGGTAKLATSALSGTGTLRMRFGAKPGGAQLAGAYSAQLTWELVAPDS